MSKRNGGTVDAMDLMDADGFEVIADDSGEAESAESAEWVTQLQKGDVFSGTLGQPFFATFKDERRVTYRIIEADGKVKLLGERAGLKPLRDEKVGTEVRILVLGESDLGNNRTAWRFKVQAKRNAKSREPSCMAVLQREYKKLDAVPF
jgi:hypothetical protein